MRRRGLQEASRLSMSLSWSTCSFAEQKDFFLWIMQVFSTWCKTLSSLVRITYMDFAITRIWGIDSVCLPQATSTDFIPLLTCWCVHLMFWSVLRWETQQCNRIFIYLQWPFRLVDNNAQPAWSGSQPKKLNYMIWSAIGVYADRKYGQD